MIPSSHRCDSCRAMPDVECLGRIARWEYHDGVYVLLCRKSLDYWLDLADDDPAMEPAKLVIRLGSKDIIYVPEEEESAYA